MACERRKSSKVFVFAQISLAEQNILRGPQLMPHLRRFDSLREIDLSAPARSSVTMSSTFILDDKTITTFFQFLSAQCRLVHFTIPSVPSFQIFCPNSQIVEHAENL